MSSSFTVLIIDDDAAHRRLVCEVVTGLQGIARTAETGEGGVLAFEAGPANLVMLDLGLPDLDGVEVCRRLRRLPTGGSAFILLLTGRSDLADRVAGFHAGADDYLIKPVDIYELSLRIKAIRRRQGSTASETAVPLQVAGWCLDPASRTLQRPEGAVALTPAEFQLLAHLMARPGSLCSTDSLLQAVWHYPPRAGSPDLVRFHVRNLRKKIEPDPDQPAHLVSVPHHGYMVRPPGFGGA
jgi:DNA-binding response OmpR family regulator